MWKENQIKKLNNIKEINESQNKSLEENRKSCIGLIAKADARTADSMEANKIGGIAVKTPTLVLQVSAIVGNKPSPKVLIQFMKALTTYFDHTPRTFAVLHIILKYAMA